MNDKQLVYLMTIENIDFYRYKVKPLRYFFTPLASYESLFSRKIRETLEYLKGGYQSIYFFKENIVIGYATITKGGGRNKFSNKKDRVLCNLWIVPNERGKGYGKIAVNGLCKIARQGSEKIYAYIHIDNAASKKVAMHNGFTKKCHATRRGILRSIVIDERGKLEIYEL